MMIGIAFVSMQFVCGPAVTGDMMLAGVAYLENEYPFESPEARHQLAGPGNLKPVEDWEICGQLRHTRLFSFQATWGTPWANYEVIGITDRGTVLRLQERSDFNALLQSEEIVPRDAKNVLKIARLYFHVIGITSTLSYGVREGIRIINSLDDIPFGLNKDREDAAKQVKVVEPTVVKTRDGGFLFTGYSWVGRAGGALYKRELGFGKEGLLSTSATLLFRSSLLEGIE
jgi:hypothetical protein